MPDDSTAPLVVTRTVDISTATTVQLRVPRSTAVEWCPEFRGNERLLRAAADGHAHRLVFEAMRAGGVGAGRWRAVFPGGDRVEIECISTQAAVAVTGRAG